MLIVDTMFVCIVDIIVDTACSHAATIKDVKSSLNEIEKMINSVHVQLLSCSSTLEMMMLANINYKPL